MAAFIMPMGDMQSGFSIETQGSRPGHKAGIFLIPSSSCFTDFVGTIISKQAFSRNMSQSDSSARTFPPSWKEVHGSNTQAMATKYWKVKQKNAQLSKEKSRERSSEWLADSLLQLLRSQLAVPAA